MKNSAAASPHFDYRPLLCEDVAALLSGRGTTINELDILGLALQRGRILLQARGGAGKTSMLQRLIVNSEAQGLTAVYRTAPRMIDSLGTMTIAREDVRTLLDSVLEESDAQLILLDGLNEVTDRVGNDILRSIEDLTFRRPDVGVIVADRVSKRPMLRDRWTFVTLSPVSRDSVAEVLGASFDERMLGVLSNPYYLELARSGRPGYSRAEVQRQTLLDAGLDRKAQLILGEAVADHYAQHGNRQIGLGDLDVRSVPPTIIERLLEAGLINSVGLMSHHLLCDYLASCIFTTDPNSWSRSTFDLLSFRGVSLDAIAILAEQVEDRLVDLFLRRVHDWNFYASAYMLVAARIVGQRVSPPVETVLLAMLGEKRFDRIRASVEDASDLLAAHPSAVAGALNSAASWDDVHAAVADQIYSASWYQNWQRLFLREPAAPADESDLEAVASTEGVIGWTASNCLRRLRLSEAQLFLIADLVHSPDPVIRWRAIHVMGAHEFAPFVPLLITVITTDAHDGVRAGAVRSLIEVAARASSDDGSIIREGVFAALASAVSDISADSGLLQVIERDLRVSPTPTGWSEAAGVLLENLWAQSESVESQDRWRRVAQALRDDERAKRSRPETPGR